MDIEIITDKLNSIMEELAKKRPPAVTQSILLSRKRFKTRASAVAWLKAHKKKSDKIDVTANYWRARQKEPNLFVPASFRIIEIDKGIKMIVGHLKKAKK